MADENDFLKFNNGQEFRFLNFKEIREEDLKNADAETKRLFNIFAGDDHILQADEAQSLWNRLKSAASTNKKGDNSVFDNDEMQKFLAKDKDIKATKQKFSLDSLTALITQVFATPQITKPKVVQTPVIEKRQATEDDVIEYTPEEIENISVSTLSEDVSEARRLYNAQNAEQGAISDLVNGTKELFDTEYASSRVGRYIRKEELCVDLLERAKSEQGLSQKEYLEAKIDFVISLIEDLERYSVRTEVTQDTINIALNFITAGFAGEKKTKNSQELEQEKRELENLKQMLAKLSPEEINQVIMSLMSINDGSCGNIDLSFGGKKNKQIPQPKQEPKFKDMVSFSLTMPEYEAQATEGSLESLSSTNAVYKKMTFEETFETERGVKYNADAIMDYTQKDSYTQFLLDMNNRRVQVAELLKEARFIKTTQGLGSESVPGEIQANASRLMMNLTTALKSVYGNDTSKIQAFLDEIFPQNNNSQFASFYTRPEIITNENGEFVSLSFGVEGETTTITNEKGEEVQLRLPNLNMKIDDRTIQSMISIADKLQTNLNINYEKALNGRTLDDYANEVSEAYTRAYGNGDSQALAQAYVQSQQEGVGTVKGVVSGVGMAVMVAGQLIPVGGQVAAAMAMGGLATATLGSSAVTATELLTKSGKVTDEEVKELVKELATSIALTASGMKIGKMSEGVYRYLAIAKQCPKLLAFAAEIGTDATMSLVADLAITGQIDLSGEGIAQLQGVLVGILHAKGNFKNYLNTHAEVLPSKDVVSYEVDRNMNRVKRAVTSVKDKTVETYNSGKKLFRGISNLISYEKLDFKLKNSGIKNNFQRENLIKLLNDSDFESEEIFNKIVDSIKNLRSMNIREQDIEYILYCITNAGEGNIRIFNDNSIKIIEELKETYKLSSDNLDEYGITDLFLITKDNSNHLELIKEINMTIRAGYNYKDAKSMVQRYKIKGEEARKAFEDIKNSDIVKSKCNEYRNPVIIACKYFAQCCNSKGEFVSDNWKHIQDLENLGIRNANDLFDNIKNDDINITKSNVETIIAKFQEAPYEINTYSLATQLKNCITKDGRLDLGMLDDVKRLNKAASGIDYSLFKNTDGTYNKNAISLLEQLKNAGFEDNGVLSNIILLAKKNLDKTQKTSEILSTEIINTAIDLKNKGIDEYIIGNAINNCYHKGKLDSELLEATEPLLKLLSKTEEGYYLEQDFYELSLLKMDGIDSVKKVVDNCVKLKQSGFDYNEIGLLNLISRQGIVPDDVIDALIKLKENKVENLSNNLAIIRNQDGSLNQQSFKFLLELKSQGFDDYRLDNIVEMCVRENGEFIPENKDIVMSLIKQYTDSKFEDGTPTILVKALVDASCDKSGVIQPKILEFNQSKLDKLYDALETDDKDSFIYILRSSVTDDGIFDENYFKKYNEVKYLDDRISDPNYSKTVQNFLDACKDENGKINLDAYDDALIMVKKYGFTKHEVSYLLPIYRDFKNLTGKNNIYDLSLQEKRKLQALLLSYNTSFDQIKRIKKIAKSDLLPTNAAEYSKIMKQLSQSLGNVEIVLDKNILDNLDKSINDLSNKFSLAKDIEEVTLSENYTSLLKKIQSKMSGLSEAEKRKIYDFLGFSVKNGEIVGFPSTLGKNIDYTDITNSFTKKAALACLKVIDDFNTNNVIKVKDNPELSDTLTSIFHSMPEIGNKFSNSSKAKETINLLKTITTSSEYKNLSESNKKLLVLSALLKDSNCGNLKETAFTIYNMTNKLGLTSAEKEKLFKLIELPEIIENCNKANPDKIIQRYTRGQTFTSNERDEALDLLAFVIKDNEIDKLSYLLYKGNGTDQISANLKSELETRIFEIKKDDFILPQTSVETLTSITGTIKTINGYDIEVVEASSIPEFYAFVHTPDAGAASGMQTRETKFSNFEEFKNIDNNSVICTSYVSSELSATWLKHGFIFKVKSGHEHVGMGHDMFSLCKTTEEMIGEYYSDKGLKALSGKGHKYSHRTFVSSRLKDMLHVSENSYSDLIKRKSVLNEKLKSLSEIDVQYKTIQEQIAVIDNEIIKIDNDYVTRMDNLKNKLSSEQYSLDNIRNIDPELAKAYEQFLALDNTGHKFGKEALMRNDDWNEVLVSNPEISAIYTKDINELPEEYLKLAQEKNLKIIILK